MVPQNPYAENISSLAVFAYKAYKEVNNINWSKRCGTLIQKDWYSWKEEEGNRDVHAERKGMSSHEEMAICKPVKEASGKTKPNTVILDFWPPEL